MALQAIESNDILISELDIHKTHVLLNICHIMLCWRRRRREMICNELYVIGHDSALIRLYWARNNLGKRRERNEMNCMAGHDSALVRLYWAGDNLG